MSGIFDYRFKKTMQDQKMQLQMIILANMIHHQKSTLAKDSFDRESLPEESQYDLPFSFNQ